MEKPMDEVKPAYRYAGFSRKAWTAASLSFLLQLQGENVMARQNPFPWFNTDVMARQNPFPWFNTDSETVRHSGLAIENKGTTRASWLSEVQREIQHIRNMSPGWGSAFSLAEMVMLELGDLDLKP